MSLLQIVEDINVDRHGCYVPVPIFIRKVQRLSQVLDQSAEDVACAEEWRITLESYLILNVKFRSGDDLLRLPIAATLTQRDPGTTFSGISTSMTSLTTWPFKQTERCSNFSKPRCTSDNMDEVLTVILKFSWFKNGKKKVHKLTFWTEQPAFNLSYFNASGLGEFWRNKQKKQSIISH